MYTSMLPWLQSCTTTRRRSRRDRRIPLNHAEDVVVRPDALRGPRGRPPHRARRAHARRRPARRHARRRRAVGPCLARRAPPALVCRPPGLGRHGDGHRGRDGHRHRGRRRARRARRHRPGRHPPGRRPRRRASPTSRDRGGGRAPLRPLRHGRLLHPDRGRGRLHRHPRHQREPGDGAVGRPVARASAPTRGRSPHRPAATGSSSWTSPTRPSPAARSTSPPSAAPTSPRAGRPTPTAPRPPTPRRPSRASSCPWPVRRATSSPS